MTNIKKLFVVITSIILVIFLSACGDNRVNVEFRQDPVAHRNTISVELRLNDPYQLVSTATGSFRVTIHDTEDDDRLVATHSFSSTTNDWQQHDFEDLIQDRTYLIRVYITRAGSVQRIHQRSVTTTVTGTYDNPIIIYNKEDFLAIRRDSSAYYIIKGNNYNYIDLEDAMIDSMFTEARPFRGNITSYGETSVTIKNFRITQARPNVGLFGVIASEGVISGINFENVYINIGRAVATNIGVLAGINRGLIENVNIENVEFEFRATGSGNMVIGGVVGSNEDRGTISNVHINNLDMNVRPRNITFLGGLIGRNRNTLQLGPNFSALIEESTVRNFTLEATNTFNTNALIVYRFGGFVGQNEGRIHDSLSEFSMDFNVNETSSTEEFRVYAGGFAGANTHGATIERVVTASSLNITSNTLANLRASLFVANALTYANAEDILILEEVSNIHLNITTSLFYPAECNCNEGTCNCGTSCSGYIPADEDNPHIAHPIVPICCTYGRDGERREDLRFILSLVVSTENATGRVRRVFVIGENGLNITLGEDVRETEFTEEMDLLEFTVTTVTANSLGGATFAQRFLGDINAILAEGSLLRPSQTPTNNR